MDVQAQIPPGLAAVHNFILDQDDTDIQHYLEILNNLNISTDPFNSATFGKPGQGAIGRAERECASVLQDQMASQMWDSYQQYLRDHPEVLEDKFVPKIY